MEEKHYELSTHEILVRLFYWDFCNKEDCSNSKLFNFNYPVVENIEDVDALVF